MLTRQRRTLFALTLTALAVVLTASPAAAAPARGHLFPTTIALPAGFQPEGIAIGARPYAYFGSRANGDIYRANLATGRGRVISAGPGTQSLGMKIDNRSRLFVAGGNAGNARVIDVRTGRVLASYQFATGTTFVNDVVLAHGAAWFTDSLNPVLYKLPLGRRGSLPTAAQVVRVPLTGAITYGPGNNANGIARTPDGRALLIVQSNTGRLFRVDPATGVTTAVDLGGESLIYGDGLLLQGRTLYAVQNRLNTVAVLRLDSAGRTGRLIERVSDPRFDVPTTIAAYGNRLYLPNARFTTPATPTTTYTAVAIRRP